MWFSQLFLKVDNGVGIELYKEDNSGRSVPGRGTQVKQSPGRDLE